MLRFWLTERLSHWGKLQKREHLYKKQFTWPVMFSIPIAIMEEICLNYSLFLPSPSSPLALQPSLNLVFMMSACCHGSYSVTDVLWLHCRIEAEENLGWKRTSLKLISSISVVQRSIPFTFTCSKKKVKWCFVEGWPIINVVEMTKMPKASTKEKMLCSLTLGLWRVVKIYVFNPML